MFHNKNKYSVNIKLIALNLIDKIQEDDIPENFMFLNQVHKYYFYKYM